MKIEVFHPGAGEVRRPGTTRAEQSAGIHVLAGATIALFSNNKPNVNLFFDELSERLVADHGVGRVIRGGKLSSAFPANPADIDAVAQADLIINGVAD